MALSLKEAKEIISECQRSNNINPSEKMSDDRSLARYQSFLESFLSQEEKSQLLYIAPNSNGSTSKEAKELISELNIKQTSAYDQLLAFLSYFYFCNNKTAKEVLKNLIENSNAKKEIKNHVKLRGYSEEKTKKITEILLKEIKRTVAPEILEEQKRIEKETLFLFLNDTINYLVTLLNTKNISETKKIFVKTCNVLSIDIFYPSINYSKYESFSDHNSIYLGFNIIKDLQEEKELLLSIEVYKKGKKWASVQEFLKETYKDFQGDKINVLENLIKAGCFDEFYKDRDNLFQISKRWVSILSKNPEISSGKIEKELQELLNKQINLEYNNQIREKYTGIKHNKNTRYPNLYINVNDIKTAQAVFNITKILSKKNNYRTYISSYFDPKSLKEFKSPRFYMYYLSANDINTLLDENIKIKAR